MNTVIYRALARDGPPYFARLRRGNFKEIAVTLPKFLSDQGLKQIIPPLATAAGLLWTDLDEYTVVLYPFIEEQSGASMTDRHWYEFGAAMKQVHTLHPGIWTHSP